MAQYVIEASLEPLLLFEQGLFLFSHRTVTEIEPKVQLSSALPVFLQNVKVLLYCIIVLASFIKRFSSFRLKK